MISKMENEIIMLIISLLCFSFFVIISSLNITYFVYILFYEAVFIIKTIIKIL